MKDYNEVISKLSSEWKFEEDLPFKDYYMRVQAELKRVGFKPTAEQLDAILDLDIVTLVDSTAGSGKTTTIVVKSILDEVIWNVHPYHIVFITFSKKSAWDMRDKRDFYMRKHYSVKNQARMSTLHSLCFKFLKAFSKVPGGLRAFSENRLIYEGLDNLDVGDTNFDGDSDTRSSFGLNFGDIGIGPAYDYEERTPLTSVIKIMNRFIEGDESLEYINNMIEKKNIMSCFAYQSERMLSDEEMFKERVFQSLTCKEEDYSTLRAKVTEYKKMFEFFDFTDLESMTLDILRNNREFFFNNNTFMTVFKPTKLYVDEMQDMTPLQKQLIKELVEIPVADGRQTSLVCIGDGDQSIYTWRGADTLEFSSFQKVFDPEKVRSKLKIFSKNHRCGANILAPSKKLIDFNTLRNQKDMVSREGSLGTFDIKYYMNSREQIKYITEEIKEEIKENGKTNLNEIAIIYREHAQVMGLVTSFLRNDIPFELSGIKLPYKHWIFTTLMEMCKSLLFDAREDNVDIIYKFTSINKKDIANLKKAMADLSYEKKQNVGWLDTLMNNMRTGRKPIISKDSLSELMTIKKALESDNTSVRTILQKLYSLYNLHNLDYVLKNLIYVERAEIESVEIFISAIPSKETYVELSKNISDWSRYIENYRTLKYGVRLMTMHSTKGLEFETVYIIGLDSDYTPKEMYVKELNDKNALEYVEEERRLLFVGMTRAINRLVIFASIARPSRFIEQIDEDFKIPENLTNKENETSNIDGEEVNNKSLVQPIRVDLKLKISTQLDKVFEEEFKSCLKRIV